MPTAQGKIQVWVTDCRQLVDSPTLHTSSRKDKILLLSRSRSLRSPHKNSCSKGTLLFWLLQSLVEVVLAPERGPSMLSNTDMTDSKVLEAPK